MISLIVGTGPNLYRVDVPVALGVALPSYARGATAAEARHAVTTDLSAQVAAMAHAKVEKVDLNAPVVV